MKSTPLLLLLSVLVLTLGGCGKRKNTESSSFDHMKDVSTAPLPLQTAANAVVKVLTESGNGTGFFVSATGELMTNNHVLGVDESLCAREGCYIEIQHNFQKGKPFSAPIEVFAEPLHVSPELDASLFQLWEDGTKTKRVASPEYLSFETSPQDDAAMHALSHPAGGLKKWASGKLYNRRGAYFWMDSYLLPGSSGSPIVNDNGKVAGLLHRVTNTIDRITRNDPNHFSIGTWVTDLNGWLRAGRRRDLFFSVKDPVTLEEAAANYDAYLMAHEGQAEIKGRGKVPFLEILGTRCDEALGRKKHGSTDALEKELLACSRVFSYLNCRNPEDGKAYKACPVGPAKEVWRQRFAKAAQLAEQFHSARHLSFLLAPWRLEATAEDSKRVETERLEAFVRRAAPPLSFSLADTLLTMYGPDTRYNGVKVSQFVKDYRRMPRYQYSWDEILEGHLTLFEGGGLNRQEIVEALAHMLHDPKLDVGNKLSLEAAAFRLGLF